MEAKRRTKPRQTDNSGTRMAAAQRNASGGAAPSQIEVSDWINQQKISRLQVLVLCLCGACALLEGLDAQIMGFLDDALLLVRHRLDVL